MTDTLPRTLIAGLGNIFLGDDGFGVEVARRLLKSPPPGNVRVVDIGIKSLKLIEALLDGYDLVIILDAVARGGRPGTLYVIEPETDSHETSCEFMPMLDPHELSPTLALRAAAKMGGRLGRVLLVGCEPLAMGEDFDRAGGLSDPVSKAVERAAEVTRQLVADNTGVNKVALRMPACIQGGES